VTELVYRKQLRPVIQSGSTLMDQLFAANKTELGGQEPSDAGEPGSLGGEPGSDRG
jgi:hypothetical protein